MPTLEEQIQIACVEWANMQPICVGELRGKIGDYLFAIPNGGYRHSVQYVDGDGKKQRYSPEAKKLKAMGVKAGVADLFLMIPRGKYHGLWIEMKAPDGATSKAQNDFLGRADLTGYAIAVVRDVAHFRHVVMTYLGGVVEVTGRIRERVMERGTRAAV